MSTTPDALRTKDSERMQNWFLKLNKLWKGMEPCIQKCILEKYENSPSGFPCMISEWKSIFKTVLCIMQRQNDGSRGFTQDCVDAVDYAVYMNGWENNLVMKFVQVMFLLASKGYDKVVFGESVPPKPTSNPSNTPINPQSHNPFDYLNPASHSFILNIHHHPAQLPAQPSNSNNDLLDVLTDFHNRHNNDLDDIKKSQKSQHDELLRKIGELQNSNELLVDKHNDLHRKIEENNRRGNWYGDEYSDSDDDRYHFDFPRFRFNQG